MRTTAEYKFILNSPLHGHQLINIKAIENGHTDSMDIYAADSFDCAWHDKEGNEVNSGYRLTKDRKSRVLITIVNSYRKDIKDNKTRLLTINND